MCVFSGGCPAESSIFWVTQNLADFSQFATLIDIYHINQYFNAVSSVLCLYRCMSDCFLLFLFSFIWFMLVTRGTCLWFVFAFQIDALTVLYPRQTAELIVEDLPGLPEKSEIINVVFSYILISPEERGLLEMLEHLIMLTGQVNTEYSVCVTDWMNDRSWTTLILFLSPCVRQRGLECSSYQQM